MLWWRKQPKRRYVYPLPPPLGLVLQQQKLSGAGVESLLIDYAQLSIAHLTRALNDPGKLGIITRALMQLQHDHLGMHNMGQMGKNANHYRLIKQLELASEAVLSIRPVLDTADGLSTDADDLFRRPHMPKAPPLGLGSLTNNLHADPRMLGERQAIPASVYHCLAEY